MCNNSFRACYIFLFILFTTRTCTTSGKVFPAVLESSVTLECSIRQTDTLIWDRADGTIIAIKGALHQGANSSKYLLQPSGADTQALIVHALALGDDGEYRCYDLADTGRQERFQIKILGKPC